MDLDLASQIISATLGWPPSEVVPVIGKGSVNQIFIATSPTEEAVVRLSKPEDSHRALPFYEKEAWCLDEAARLGIPGPVALAVGSWAGRPYMLQSLAPGINGEEHSSGKPAIWRTLGRYSKLIHTVRLDGFGETLAGFRAGNAQAEWERFVNYNVDSLTGHDELIALRVYHPEQASQIREWFIELRGIPFTFGLNHCDLAPRNTVVNDDGQVSLLDWGSAEAHIVPHYDFISLLRDHDPVDSDMAAFLQGYGLADVEFARLLPELRSMLLLKEFDLTRWAIDRCPECIPAMAERASMALRNKLGQ